MEYGFIGARVCAEHLRVPTITHITRECAARRLLLAVKQFVHKKESESGVA